MVTINGVEYRNIAIACKDTHVSTCTVYSLMKEKGIYDAGKALELVIKRRHGKIRGKYTGLLREHGYPDFKSLSKDCGLSITTIYYRLEGGASFEDAIKPRRYKGIECTIFGETFKSRKSACEAYGASYAYINKAYGGDQFDKKLERYCIRNNKTRKVDTVNG